MIAFVPPALLLGILLSTGYAGLFHLWGGRSVRDLLVYLCAGGCGFAVGQLVGILARSPLPQIGELHVVEGSLMAWLALIGVRELLL